MLCMPKQPLHSLQMQSPKYMNERKRRDPSPPFTSPNCKVDKMLVWCKELQINQKREHINNMQWNSISWLGTYGWVVGAISRWLSFGVRNKVSCPCVCLGGVSGVRKREREREIFVRNVSPVVSALWKGPLSMIMSPGEGHEWVKPLVRGQIKHKAVHALVLIGWRKHTLRHVSWFFDGRRSCFKQQNVGYVPLPSVLDRFFFPPCLYPPRISPPPPHRVHTSSVWLSPPHILSFLSYLKIAVHLCNHFFFFPSPTPRTAFVCSEVSWTQEWRRRGGGEWINKCTKKPGTRLHESLDEKTCDADLKQHAGVSRVYNKDALKTRTSILTARCLE